MMEHRGVELTPDQIAAQDVARQVQRSREIAHRKHGKSAPVKSWGFKQGGKRRKGGSK